MNTIAKRILKAFTMTALIMPVVTSCNDNIIYEDLPDCENGAKLRFVYDYNMEYANAFHNQVDCLDVFVYDENDNYVTAKQVKGDELKDENYRMTIDLEAGTYTIVAYGGMACEMSSFNFTDHPTNGGNKPSNVVNLKEDEIGNELHALFFGKCEVTVGERDLDYQEETVYMLKDTNAIRVLLQQVNGEPLDYNEFDFKIYADNAQMQHDNKVVLADQTTAFPTWVNGNEKPGNLLDGTNASVAWGEFSIPRLVNETEVANLTKADSYQGPTLEIKYKHDDRMVVNIPLIQYLLLCKPVGNTKAGKPMDDQEFLDRESRYNLYFFLDRHYQWIYCQIEVEDWVVRVNNPQF